MRASPVIGDIDRRWLELGLGVVGVDEVGRGALAGPVVAGAVYLSRQTMMLLTDPLDLNDSKKLTPRQRTRWAARIHREFKYGIGSTSASDVEAKGIVPATFAAMVEAVRIACFGVKDDLVILVDGTVAPVEMEKFRPAKLLPVVRGDSRSLAIAAASIVAKVHRDRIMDEDPTGKAYGWPKNKGYGTADHLAAIKEHGVAPGHRVSFVESAMAKMRGKMAQMRLAV